jgi:two-component system sensor histidine kinase MtrB
MAGSTFRSEIRRALTFWRRSIQARVVASTVVLSAVVVTAVGWVLLQQTQRGLLDHRVDAVLVEVNTAMAEANKQLDGALTSSDPNEQQTALGDLFVQRGGSRGFRVVLIGPIGAVPTIDEGAPILTRGLHTSSVPASLEQHFAEVADTAWTYTRIRADGERPVPGIVVGSQLQLPAGGLYTAYFLFPLDEEQETLALVTRAMVTAAALLLLLVAGLTWLVTRQVVTPVRMARRVAERLAAGQLQERVQVKGEDDLARLAMSFNQMASNLQRQIRQLEELSRVQQQFVSDVSHELRTPLTTVRMAGDVLHDARRSFDPATSRAAELLQKELDRFETLLVDLLEISRFDAGAAVLDLDEVNLVDVAQRIVDQTRALADQRHTRVVVEAPDHACLAEADVRRVERIVRNLVTNAIDHAQNGFGETRDVVVHVAGDEQAAAIAVRDYGVGLRPGESAMVFNRFWRADPARARTSGGTGLGLSISLEDTHLHGGWLQAWGRLGEGAQFRLTLPRRAGMPLRQSPLPLVPVDAREVVV